MIVSGIDARIVERPEVSKRIRVISHVPTAPTTAAGNQHTDWKRRMSTTQDAAQ
jgi:hypothetical protein